MSKLEETQRVNRKLLEEYHNIAGQLSQAQASLRNVRGALANLRLEAIHYQMTGVGVEHLNKAIEDAGRAFEASRFHEGVQ